MFFFNISGSVRELYIQKVVIHKQIVSLQIKIDKIYTVNDKLEDDQFLVEVIICKTEKILLIEAEAERIKQENLKSVMDLYREGKINQETFETIIKNLNK